MKLGFIGNFIPAHSTENDRRWSFEKLGHTVIPFQENKTTLEQLLKALPNLDLLLYSHTHDPNYVINGLKDVFSKYREMGIPTASVHLDRWAWLKRVEDVGKEATWFTEYLFMADGSPEAVELYERYKLNWYWLKAGVVERDCYIAEPDKQKFPHDIIFVGSKGYHPEYDFRPKLINFLKETYGDKFGHYGGDGIKVVRGKELNQLYSTAKVCIGDSCFGNRTQYVSDRYYETRGRGGFLLHPKVKDIDSVGVAHYENGDLKSLKGLIDYYLRYDESRENARIKGFNWVKENETYTQRSEEMLKVIFET